MSTAVRVLSALAVTAVLAAGASDASASPAAGADITARASQDVVATGETVVLRGLLTRARMPSAGSLVRVQRGHVGAWQNLDGARVRTGPDGRYRVRVVLYRHGVRDLRVVGVRPGPARDAFARVTLMVKRR